MRRKQSLSFISLLLVLVMLLLLLAACNPRIQRAAENTWDEAQRNLQREWERTQQEQQRGGATGGLLCPDVGAVLLLPIAIGVWKVSGVGECIVAGTVKCAAEEATKCVLGGVSR